MEDLAPPLIAFIKTHEGWAAPIVFAVAFTETSAFVSLAFPGVTLLIAAGALLQSGVLAPAPVAAAGILGAVLGAALSYRIGRRYGGAVAGGWLARRNRDLLPAGIRFFERHGGKSVFIGRFYGPLRATIPLAAGILDMRPGRFWLANIAASLVWAPMLLLVGDVVGAAGERLVGAANTIVVTVAGLALFAALGVLLAVLRARR